ncbi:MAG: AMP-binding protein [Acidiferrobacterales bacterium]|nr:AMP-binding protein [Acidiferrobacterales bacterium]
MSEFAALINRKSEDRIAWLSKPLPPLKLSAGAVIAQQFIEHVTALATKLPDAQLNDAYCINLCHNRYLFMVTFCAVVLRQHTNLLPSNKNVATQSRLHERYQGAYIVHDGLTELYGDIKAIDLQNLDISDADSSDIPKINLDHIAAISFTSGSTGDAKAIVKTWRTFVASTEINARYMLPNSQDTFYHLATVPSQHMWGLETTVLMAMFANVCLVDAQPFFPPDIFALLKQLPQPKCLVTTPLHLRAIQSSKVDETSIQNVLVATAPLNIELAQSIEHKLNTQVREVYGCSEVGSMSIRRPAQQQQWQRFAGLEFVPQENGNTLVQAAHISEDVVLDDQITLLDDQTFLLSGRKTDQINIAGKRGSLLEVNNVLMKFPGLQDGVVIFPEQDRTVPRLVALVVLDRDANKEALREHFNHYLDAAFVPRPILIVDALPREENGKLKKQKVLDLYHQLRG